MAKFKDGQPVLIEGIVHRVWDDGTVTFQIAANGQRFTVNPDYIGDSIHPDDSRANTRVRKRAEER